MESNSKIIIRVNPVLVIIMILLSIMFASCTDNQRARSYGGTETIKLKPGEKLLTATWKGEKGAADLWYLTEPMDSSYIPKTKSFKEHSDFGVLEGTVIFIETK